MIRLIAAVMLLTIAATAAAEISFVSCTAGAPGNNPPVVNIPIPDRTATAETAYSYQLPANTFTDVDVGDGMTYTAALSSGSALPSWLAFNAATRTFSGTPLAGNVGTITVRVTVRDNALTTAIDDFTLTVNAAGASLNGWDLNASNTGLAGVGLTCAGLEPYTGLMKPPANTTISNVRITLTEMDLSNGNITLDRVCIQPTTAGNRSSIIFGYNPDGGPQLGPVTIRDSDFDASQISVPPNNLVYAICAFRGAANLYRNKMWGMGTGICYFDSPNQTTAVIEGNYVYGLRAGMFGNPPQQSHNESATIRSFLGTSMVWRGNYLESRSGADSGALFINTFGGNIQNVLITGNLLDTAAWGMPLEAGYGNTYSNMSATNNRFSPTSGSFGAAYNSGGPGWNVWSGNVRYDIPSATIGTTVACPGGTCAAQ